MLCPYCKTSKVVKNGTDFCDQGEGWEIIQTYLCKACGKRFRERSGSAMVGLRTRQAKIDRALRMLNKGMSLRTVSRSVGVSHSTVLRWQRSFLEKNVSASNVVSQQND